MNNIEIDKIALWKAKALDELTIRESAVGRQYFDHGIGKTAEDKILRYAKNYQVKKEDESIKFCLFVFTFLSSKEKVENILDKTAEKITFDQVKEVVEKSTDVVFEYLDYYVKGDE